MHPKSITRRALLLALVAPLSAADFVAHCSLKGVFLPDGAFTASASVTVSLSTQVPPSRTFNTISGAVSLVLNSQLNAGSWQATGLLAGVAGTPDG